MTQNQDSRHRDQEAYRYYLHDGLQDILVGLSLLFAGFYLSTDLSAALVAIWVVLWLPLWRSARKAIVAPRVHDTDVSPEQTARARRAGVFLIVIVAGSTLLAVVAGIGVLVGKETVLIPEWSISWLRQYLILALGLLAAVTLGVAAWLSGLNRLYAYAVVTLAVFSAGYLIDAPIPLAAAVIGGVVTLWGLVMLTRFVRRYPAQQTQTNGSGIDGG
jgi:hypothetical protein